MNMFKLRSARLYRNEETGEQGGSGIDLNNPEIQKIIQAKIDETVAGLKRKNSELIEKEKKLKEHIAQFDGVNIEQVKNLQKQIQENEEMRLLAEGKTEEVVSRRVDTRVDAMRRDFESNIAARDAKLTEYENLIKHKEERLAELVIDGQLREAYLGLDFDPDALDFVLMQGRQTFIMNEDGKAVPRDPNGNLIFGKDGKTPITAREWLEGLAEKKKFLRKPSKGAGATPNRVSGSIDVSKMTPSQKIAEGLRLRG